MNLLCVRQRPTVCVTCAGAGTAKPSNWKKAEERKRLEIRSESPASGARYVGRTACYRNYDIDYSLKIKSGHGLARGAGMERRGGSKQGDEEKGRKKEKTGSRQSPAAPRTGKRERGSQAKANFHETKKSNKEWKIKRQPKTGPN